MKKFTPEQISSQRGRTTLLNAMAAACFSLFAIKSAYHYPSHAPAFIALWALWMGVTAVWTFGIPGALRFSKAQRNVINDELARSHQAAAAKFGLALAVAGLLVLSISGFSQVALPLWTAPAMTSAIVVATGLYFAVLQLRYE